MHSRWSELLGASARLPFSWLGVAAAGVMIGTAVWIIGWKEQDRRIHVGALETAAYISSEAIAELGRSTSAADELIERLVNLQARVDSLDASVGRMFDSIDDVNARFSSLVASASSRSATKSGAPAQVSSGERKPVAATGQRHAASVSTGKPTEVPAGGQKSMAKSEDANRPASASTTAPGSAVRTSMAPVALFRSYEVLQSLHYSVRKRPTDGGDEQAVAASGAPDEATPEVTSADKMPAVSRDDRPWVINLASYSDKRDADRFASRVQSRSVQVEKNQVTVRGKPYWRVQVPGFSSAEDAKTHAASIESQLGLKETWVMRR
jgi:hypothetical protein